VNEEIPEALKLKALKVREVLREQDATKSTITEDPERFVLARSDSNAIELLEKNKIKISLYAVLVRELYEALKSGRVNRALTRLSTALLEC
jgi:uridylate kinase